MGAPPEIQMRAPQSQRPGIGQRNFDPDPEHPSDFHRAVTKGIVIVLPRWHARSKIDVGYGIDDAGDRQPAGGKYRRAAHGLLDADARSDDPWNLRFHGLVQTNGIELVRFRGHDAEGAIDLYPEKYAAEVEFLSHQRAADVAGFFVIEKRAGIAPVRKAIDVDNAIVRPTETCEDARVSPSPVESGEVAIGVHGSDACEHQQERQRKKCVIACENPPEREPRVFFHGSCLPHRLLTKHHAPVFRGLLEGFQFAVLDNQYLRGVNGIPVGIEREFAENGVKISDIRQLVSNRPRVA